jgi:hypothetical protein
LQGLQNLLSFKQGVVRVGVFGFIGDQGQLLHPLRLAGR